MGKRVDRIGQWATVALSAVLAAAGVVILRHALETPQPLKSPLPGEAFLYRWKRRSIFYKVLGSADAPPLLLLHTPALGASAREMRYIMSPLARIYRVYALDLLGFGHSDRPGVEYSAAMYSELCQDFLREVIQQPATLLASRLSCNYAIAVAAATPDLCTSLVLISPTALRGEVRPSLLRRFAEKPAVKALLYPLLSTRFAFLAANRRQQAALEDFAQFHANTHQFGAEHAAMALLAGRFSMNSTRQFEEIQQPVLMIWGTQALEDQRTVASLHEAATLADPAHRARKVELIQGAGFMVHEEQPEDVVAAIGRWREENAGEVERTTTQAYTLKAPPAPSAHREKESDPAAQAANSVNRQHILAYCVKCKQKREMLNARKVTMKNGRPAMRGACAVCGTTLNRIGNPTAQE